MAPKDEEQKVRIRCEMSCPGKAPSLLSIYVRSKYYKRTRPLSLYKERELRTDTRGARTRVAQPMTARDPSQPLPLVAPVA